MKTLRETLELLKPDFSIKESSDDAEVLDKLDRTTKLDEIDTITFGIETDDGKIVKVYVKAEQASDFEKKLSDSLGKIDDIEEVLNTLAKDFEIVDVEWPSEEDVADSDIPADNGSQVLDQKVYNNAKENASIQQSAKAKTEKQMEENLSLGEKFTSSVYESEGANSIESRLTTPTQLMVYHALIELGIPELALVRSPYRAAIIKNIRDKALELQSNPVTKNALKWFINKSVDFEGKAASHAKKKQDDLEEDVQTTNQITEAEAGEWSFANDKDNIIIKNGIINITIDSEQTEKLLKGVTNRDAVVVKDAEDPKKKVVFSPRGSSIVVKNVGIPEGVTMDKAEVDTFIDFISTDIKAPE